MKRFGITVVVVYLVVQFTGAAVGGFAATYYGTEVVDLWLTVQEKIDAVIH